MNTSSSRLPPRSKPLSGGPPSCCGSGAEIIEDVPMPNTRYGIPAYFVISRVEAASNLHRFDGVKYGFRTPSRCTI